MDNECRLYLKTEQTLRSCEESPNNQVRDMRVSDILRVVRPSNGQGACRNWLSWVFALRCACEY